MTDFLALLTKTDWLRFEVSSYHTPEEISALLRAIASSDAAEAASGATSLEDVVVRQAGLYEAAYYVAAPLIAVLRESLTSNRLAVYDLLFEIANGYNSPEKFVSTHEGDKLSLRAACRREVRKGMDVFKKDQHGDDTSVCNTIRDLFESLEEAD